MKQKIILWLDADLTSFCLAYYLQQKIDGEFYAIIDITNRPKEFFLKQKLVIFQKVWFYHDYTLKNTEKNIVIEDKSELNISELVKNDRMFNPKYNEFHNFTKNEINSIISNELSLFNEILQIQPDIFITSETALRPHHTFHKLCQKKKIKTLMLNSANWGNLSYLSQDYHILDNFENYFRDHKTTSYTFDQLEKRLEKKILSKNLTNFYNKNRKSKLQKISAALQFLLVSNNHNIETHYTYFGRTKIQVLLKEIRNTINYFLRQRYIDKNFSSKIPENKNLIFFPMQQEPERTLLISAPCYTDQMKTIDLISKSIPKDFLLVVKEHPTQGPGRGWREISDYEQFRNNSRVFLIHPSVPASEIIKKSKLVISVSGTASLEASIFNTPSITFAENNFTLISSIQKFNSNDNLSLLIEKALSYQVNSDEVGKYFDILEENSFIFDQLNFQLNYLSYFYLNGNLVDVEIEQSKMRNFLNESEENFVNVITSLKKMISIN
jgi:hypothetical protein